ncbi:MobA/MobL family protein [Roseateles oligotrophus]|uniref:MobA/MobL family protein n=1 Tax=Roseateles oligotrophus TaxID=1769250 RepID=A0ABT2Y8F4_9BURK|nr:MobA/MobL family protein [Roseateles oligotrophus]MCV2366579.1 MobA/MobL family protein [Roseateles oligotrophus]
MAVFHLSARHPISRGHGRSATAAAAYRSGTAILDDRTGLKFDYRRRHGVLDARIQLPGGQLFPDRARFWNTVELHHRRKDSVVAREIVVALPAELGPCERGELAFSFAQEIADRFEVAVDVALHEPSRDGDDRNFHAHLLLSACSVTSEAVLGKKVMALDPIVCKRTGVPDSVAWLRPRWQDLVNAALAKQGSAARVDHRSHKARGIDRHPTIHMGKSGPSGRARANLNTRLRAANARAEVLEASINKLVKMRARLVGSGGGRLADADGKRVHSLPSASPLPVVAATNLRRLAPAAADSMCDLLPWRRRENRRLESLKSGQASADPCLPHLDGSDALKLVQQAPARRNRTQR